MIIGCDFDGTLAQDAYPGIGLPNYKLITRLKHLQGKGAIIILWTCREGQALDEAIDWSAKLGLKFDYVNENCPDIIRLDHENPRKLKADIYIDDRACSPKTFWRLRL